MPRATTTLLFTLFLILSYGSVRINAKFDNTATAATEVSLWTWFYDLVHPCHPDEHHDCPHHHDTKSSSSSSSNTTDVTSTYTDDINNISNDVTTSGLESESVQATSYWMYVLVAGAAVGSVIGGVLLSRKKMVDQKHPKGLISARMQSFQYFLSESSAAKCLGGDCGAIQMGDMDVDGQRGDSDVDFVRVEG